MVPVSHLPDLCLLALFRQMTLQDQIAARKVCRRWDNLVPEATSKRHELIILLGKDSIDKFENRIDQALFCRRQALKLLHNTDGSLMYPTRRLNSWNSLHLDSLDQDTAEQIASTYTAAKQLQATMLSVSSSTVDSFAHLLEQWSHQLIALQFFECGNRNINDNQITHLNAAINALSTLKCLYLDLFELPLPDMSIVSRLEELHFFSKTTTPTEFAQWLRQYGEENQGLARVEYEASFDDGQFTTLSEHLCRRFTYLCFFENPIRDPAPVSVHFSGLTSLLLAPFGITARHLFKHLSTFHQLIHLNFEFSEKTTFLNDNLEHLLLPQLKSVKALELNLSNEISFHAELIKMELGWTLPNIEVVRFEFYYFKCTECRFDEFSSAQAKHCLCQLFAPLKRNCAKLRVIQHDKEDIHGTADELLAKSSLVRGIGTIKVEHPATPCGHVVVTSTQWPTTSDRSGPTNASHWRVNLAERRVNSLNQNLAMSNIANNMYSILVEETPSPERENSPAGQFKKSLGYRIRKCTALVCNCIKLIILVLAFFASVFIDLIGAYDEEGNPVRIPYIILLLIITPLFAIQLVGFLGAILEKISLTILYWLYCLLPVVFATLSLLLPTDLDDQVFWPHFREFLLVTLEAGILSWHLVDLFKLRALSKEPEIQMRTMSAQASAAAAGA